jgi:hypothetical protein
MAIYYISPTGNDNDSGAISQPFFTLNKAWTVVTAGDVIYMRGGTFEYTSQQNLTGVNGTSGNLIKIWAYPGETPVITDITVIGAGNATTITTPAGTLQMYVKGENPYNGGNLLVLYRGTWYPNNDYDITSKITFGALVHTNSEAKLCEDKIT